MLPTPPGRPFWPRRRTPSDALVTTTSCSVSLLALSTESCASRATALATALWLRLYCKPHPCWCPNEGSCPPRNQRNHCAQCASMAEVLSCISTSMTTCGGCRYPSGHQATSGAAYGILKVQAVVQLPRFRWDPSNSYCFLRPRTVVLRARDVCRPWGAACTAPLMLHLARPPCSATSGATTPSACAW
jgi:hypothetical protein